MVCCSSGRTSGRHARLRGHNHLSNDTVGFATALLDGSDLFWLEQSIVHPFISAVDTAKVGGDVASISEVRMRRVRTAVTATALTEHLVVVVIKRDDVRIFFRERFAAIFAQVPRQVVPRWRHVERD